ncbi:hypothetical protein SAMN04488038_105297 [Solimonas aquatica]|uniref:DUF2971 domain-containing protein n=1 Tax=Solimonas aquatica TaxID=489703 RepID=A0A1H9F9Q2_9GAMM|nr:hypothetical protein [Solimonas aquatica]SEQ34555.1 hypothetical protein SAMN04488038_105297 [Solimonas aquatica]
MSEENESLVWRYMSFAKFDWTIQNKCLWLCRADLLGDPWEMSLSGEQLRLVINRHPITPIGEAQRESAEERAKRILGLWRSRTFVCCWNKSQHESNALWKIYCKNPDGVALQTTHQKLESIKDRHSLHPVTYPVPGSSNRTPTHTDLVTKKRPMFSYEEEVRIVFHDESNEAGTANGVRLEFDLDLIESIRVHPEAGEAFFEVVTNIVQTYAPKFRGKVAWSDMRLGPPL